MTNVDPANPGWRIHSIPVSLHLNRQGFLDGRAAKATQTGEVAIFRFSAEALRATHHDQAATLLHEVTDFQCHAASNIAIVIPQIVYQNHVVAT
jgi:hypothetical protein